MNTHDFIGLHEYPEFSAKTNKGKSSRSDFGNSSKKRTDTDSPGKPQQLSKLTKTLAMGTVTALAVTGAVVSGNDALSDQLNSAIGEPPISQNSVSPTDLIHTVHTWGRGVIVLEATCTGKGTLLFSCTGCDSTKTEIIPAAGHVPVAAGEDLPASCTEPGRAADIICSVCGEILEEGKEIAPEGHVYGEPEVIREATCTEAGEIGAVVCEVCGEIISEPVTVEPPGHDWGEYVQTKAATCTASGTKTRTCSRCMQTASVSVSKLGHTDSDKDYHCDRCGAKLVSLSIINAEFIPDAGYVDFRLALSSAVKDMDCSVAADFGVEYELEDENRQIHLFLYPEQDQQGDPGTEVTLFFTLTVYGTAGNGEPVTVLSEELGFKYTPRSDWYDPSYLNP